MFQQWQKIVAWAACSLLLQGATACGGSSPAAHAGHTLESSAVPTALPIGAGLLTSCPDGTGDGRQVDLTGVVMATQDDTLILEFSLAEPVPANGDLALAVEARSQDGATVRQLGVKIQNGQPVSATIGTGSDSAPEQLAGAVHIADRAVHAAFPADTVAALGPTWNWRAVVAVSSGISDLCPGDADATITSGDSISVG